MFTFRLEIKSTKSANLDFYNPAVDECRAYPRTASGAEKAIKKFEKYIAKNLDCITAARVVMYEGLHEYWKSDIKPCQIFEIM